MLVGHDRSGAIACSITCQLGEMAVDAPNAGSFGHFVSEYCYHFASLLPGWSSRMRLRLVSVAEFSTAGVHDPHKWR